MKMETIRTVLVDDEPNAISMLLFYLERVPYVVVVEKFTDAEKALEWLLVNEVDLLITDIDMPSFSGIGLVKALVKRPQVIYCTSHTKFAADTFETRPVDFLLKPVAFDRLQRSLVWAAEAVRGVKLTPGKVRDPYVFVKSLTTKHYVCVNTNEIVYVTVNHNDCTIKTLNEEVIIRKSLRDTFEELGTEDFIMTEQSFLVNKQLIREVKDNKLVMEGTDLEIPIGSTYAAGIKEFIQSKLW